MFTNKKNLEISPLSLILFFILIALILLDVYSKVNTLSESIVKIESLQSCITELTKINNEHLETIKAFMVDIDSLKQTNQRQNFDLLNLHNASLRNSAPSVTVNELVISGELQVLIFKTVVVCLGIILLYIYFSYVWSPFAVFYKVTVAPFVGLINTCTDQLYKFSHSILGPVECTALSYTDNAGNIIYVNMYNKSIEIFVQVAGVGKKFKLEEILNLKQLENVNLTIENINQAVLNNASSIPIDAVEVANMALRMFE
jgi:hypothetical protein